MDVDAITVCPIEEKGAPYSWDAFVARISRFDFIVVYSAIFILALLLIAVVFYGESTPFYENLIQPNINPWIPRTGWVIATILSYGTFFFIGQDVRVHPIPHDLIVSTLFVITSFLFLAWGIAYYYAEDVVLSMWIAVVIFIYNYWLFLYVWDINPIAAMFLVPNLLLYMYLIYTSAHTASLNDIPI